jgi:hypothetical protein
VDHAIPLRPPQPGLNLDVRSLDHIGPLLGVTGDTLSELGRGSCNDVLAQFDQPMLQLCIDEPGIDFRIELVDNFRRRAFRRDDSKPRARFVSRYDFIDCRNVW